MSAEMRPALATTRGAVVALAGLCAIAAVPRLWRLGALGLEVDEGVQGLAVQGWLHDGLPILPSGAMYQRAIPFGAMQALSASMFGTNEFALRLPAALFGVLAVAAVFALARALFGQRVAWIAALFVALSAWEVELSRYARFYTAFQVCYVLALLSFFKLLDTGRRAWALGFAAAAVLAMSFHELSIVLATCFLFPLFDRTSSARTRLLVLAGAVPFGIAWYVYRRVFVRWFATLAPPTGLEEVDPIPTDEHLITWLPGFPDLRFPPHSLVDLASMPERIALVVAAAIALIACIWIVRARRHWTSALLLLAVVSAVPHLFMLSALALLAFALLSSSTWNDWRARPMWAANGSLAALLVLWTLTLFTQVDGDLKALTLSLFGFPNLLQHFVYWFALGWPVLLAAIAVSGVLMARRFMGDADRKKIYLIVALVAPMTLASLFDAYFESRYVFHLYPLLVILFAWGLVQAWDRVSGSLIPPGRVLVAGTALAVCFIATGDVGSRTWGPMFRTYASERDPMRAIISWRAYSSFHQDQQGTSQFVKGRLAPGEKVAAIGLPHQLAVYRFYLGQLDVALSRAQDHGYQRRRGNDIIDWVTGARVVFDSQDLLRPGEPTWVVGDRVLLRDELEYFAPEVERDGRALAQDADVEGRDGVTFAKRFF